MKNKGFTLIELLSVIVILSLLAILTSTAVTKLVKDSKDDLYQNQLLAIKEAAQTWSADNLSKLPSSGNCIYLTLGDLKDYGLLDSIIIDSRNNNEISDDLKIKISSTKSKYGTLVTDYEVDSQDVSGCSLAYIKPICEKVTQETATKYENKLVGNIPTGEYKAGDEYICNVDGVNKYHFFIISTDGDDVNLIMDTNIKSDGTLSEFNANYESGWGTGAYDGDVAWISNEDYKTAGGTNSIADNSKGPLTSLKYLKEGTSGWRNIPDFSYTLIDDVSDAKYEPIKVDNVKARMLNYTEANSLCGGSNCPIYLGINTVGYDGYWLSSSWSAIDGGVSSYIDTDAVCNPPTSDLFGVRPVIQLSKPYLS